MAKERFVPVDESKKKRGCPKGGWPKKADAGKVGYPSFMLPSLSRKGWWSTGW